jgi:hypothetical protein
MDVFGPFVCDPVFSNHSTPGAVSVDDHYYLNEVPTDNFLQQEQQQMWHSGFMNVETDPTRSWFMPPSSVYFGDFSAFPYPSECDGSPAAIPAEHTQVSEIQVYAQVYDNDINA